MNVQNALIEHEPSNVVAPRRAPRTKAVAMTPMEMVGRALEMGVSAEILKQMMDLRDREEARNAKLAFTKAVSLAKAEIKPIIKNREVDYQPEGKKRVNYRHEDLAGIDEQITPILTKHGLSYRFESDNGPDRPITITCVLEHELGHSTRTPLSGAADNTGGKNSLQAIASTCTMLERYTLKLALGLSVSHDDDGRKAGETVTDAGAISSDQVKTILAIIEDVGAYTDKFCEIYRIDAVPDLPARLFDDAVSNLRAYGRRNKK